MTKAILVVSFGTTYPETRMKTIEACENAIQQRYPDYEVYRAFTSTVVIRKIEQQEGIRIPTVEEALTQLRELGIQKVFIQPLHLIFGGEYEKILTQASYFDHSFEELKIGKPLLSSIEDYQRVKEFLLATYSSQDSTDATVLMGHGSQHHAFTAYATMDHLLQGSSVHIGCVESYPPVEKLEKGLQQAGVKKVKLAPFMLVAGDHARNDMVSQDESSWYSFFKKRGYQVSTQLTGLGEFPEIQELYIQHVSDMMEE